MHLKKNLLYNSILVLSQYIIALILFPYISKTLKVSNLGIVSFVENSVNNFILFAMMGINILGVREIAMSKNKPEDLNKNFSSLLSLTLIFTLFVICIYYIIINCVPKFVIYKDLMELGILKILFSAFLIEWFYKGIENFKFIAIRNIVINLIYIFSVFFFVRTENSYHIFFLLNVSLVIINAIANIYNTRRIVKFSIKKIRLKKYLLPSFQLGAYVILTSMYTTFNVMYLGLVSSNDQVGFYWVALKVYTVILGFYTAFTNVLMPRMSELISQNRNEEFFDIIHKSFDLLFSICTPLIVIFIILAPQIIHLISGKEYNGAILPMQIILPLLLIVGIAQIIAIQIFMPMHKDKNILKSSIIGATAGLILNILLVERLGCIGTSIVLIVSETLVTSYYLIEVTKIKDIFIPWKVFFNNVLYSIPVIFEILYFQSIFDDDLVIVLFSGVVTLMYYLIVQLIVLKNNTLLMILSNLQSKL